MPFRFFKPTFDDGRQRQRVTLLLWLLVLLSLLGWVWAVRKSSGPAPAPQAAAAPAMPAAAPVSAEQLALALGASTGAAEPAPEQRFKLLGVIAGASGRGVALVAVDGQPSRPFAVGAEVAPGLLLQRVAAREVVLAESMQGPAKLTLALPQWQPRSAAAASAPPEQAGPLPPPDATAVQPGSRGDQRGP